MTALMPKESADLSKLVHKVKPCYRLNAKIFIQFLQNNGLNLDAEGCTIYQQYQDSRKQAASTYNNYIIAMKAVLRAALDMQEGFLTVAQRNDVHRWIQDVKLKKKSKSKVKVLTQDEVRAFIEGLEKRKRIDVALWIRFLWATGCRVSEMTNAEWKHLRKTEDGFSLRLVTTKFNKERFVSLDPELVKVIKSHYRSETYLFESHNGGQRSEKDHRYTREYVSHTITQEARRILHKHVTAHMMRHSIATHLLREYPERIKAISKWLGHASVQTTLDLYVHDALSDSEMLEMTQL